MTASQEMIDFLTDLSGDKAAKQLSYRLAREKKKKLVAEIDGMLTDDERDKLANAVNISTTDARTGESIPLVSDRGHRHEVETRQIGKTTGFTNAEVLELGKTLGRVLEMARKLKKDGMSAQEIADELFTPLMRQKLIPEGQIPDEFSETAKLLRETFKAYRETLKEASQECASVRVETAVKLHGATGSKLDQVLALKDTVMQFGSDTVSKTAGRVLEEDGPGGHSGRTGTRAGTGDEGDRGGESLHRTGQDGRRVPERRTCRVAGETARPDRGRLRWLGKDEDHRQGRRDGRRQRLGPWNQDGPGRHGGREGRARTATGRRPRKRTKPPRSSSARLTRPSRRR